MGQNHIGWQKTKEKVPNIARKQIERRTKHLQFNCSPMMANAFESLEILQPFRISTLVDKSM
jgi:3-deoxy-D-arabino-heptulosonate 7-phosphate (DAHP) synthase class II